MIDKAEVIIIMIIHQEPNHGYDQVLCAGQRPHNEEQCKMEACIYSDNPEIKANLDQDYMQTDPYLKVKIIITVRIKVLMMGGDCSST